MVPLLSLRSIVVISIGLILGSLLGLSYWAISPIDLEYGEGWPPLSLAGVTEPRPVSYRSTVNIELAAYGASYNTQTSLKNLQKKGEYYAAKLGSSLFLDALSLELGAQAPQYARSPDELSGMISAKYNYKADYPSVQLRVISTSRDEVSYLAATVPRIFQAYLRAEEANMEVAEYQGTQQEAEQAKNDLYEARGRRSSIRQQMGALSLDLNPEYIASTSRAVALQRQMSTVAGELALFISSQGNPEYLETEYYQQKMAELKGLSTALAESKRDLESLRWQAETEVDDLNVALAIADADVRALESRLSSLAQSLAAYTPDDDPEQNMFANLVIGEPSVPAVVPPDRIRGRKAVMEGGVLGLGLAWLGLNFRGVKQMLMGVPSEGPKRKEEEEDEEA